MLKKSNLLDKMSRGRTESLFTETSRVKDKYTPIMSLKEAYELYMNAPTEYEFAMDLLGSVAHWNKLCECDWFMNGNIKFKGLIQWRADKRLKDESATLVMLKEAAAGGDVPSIKALHKLYTSTTSATKVKSTAAEVKRAKADKGDKNQLSEFEKKQRERATANT